MLLSQLRSALESAASVCCVGVLAGVLCAPAAAQGQTAPLPAAPAVPASAPAATCAALAADAGRLGAKFTLGRESCGALPERPVARPRQAQQLYLYEGRTAPEPAASVPAVVVPSAGAVAPSSMGKPTKPRKPARRQSVSWPGALPLPAQRALQLAPTVDSAARTHDIDPLLLHAIARVESRHDAGAVSHAGARGVMQVMPGTAKRFGVGDAQALYHAPTNVQVSAAYLKTLQGRFGNDLPLVLAAYNAGEGAVEKYGRRIPPYNETQGYVRNVLAEYQRLRAAATRSRAQ